MKRFFALSAMLLLLPGQAVAADAGLASGLVNANVGHLSVIGGVNAVRHFRDRVSAEDVRNNEDTSFFELGGSYSFAVTDRLSFVLDGSYRKDNFEDERFEPDEPSNVESLDWEYMVGGHVLMNVGAASRVGLLGGYGDSNNAEDESYSLMLLGVEGQTFLSENVLGYAQVGWGNRVSGPPNDNDDQGFNNGFFGRIGATWFVSDHTALNIDFEHARVENYIDEEDAGRFTSVALNGETMLPMEGTALSVIYRAGVNHFDSTTERDYLTEYEVGIGLKLAFGATSPAEAARAGASIGLPGLPVRANSYINTLD